MSDTTCNGWTNYATWRIQLDILDDYVSNELYEDTETRDRWLDMSISDLADELEGYVDEVITNYGELQEGLALDYARAFVSDVNWYEVAEHARQDAIEAKAYDETEATA